MLRKLRCLIKGHQFFSTQKIRARFQIQHFFTECKCCKKIRFEHGPQKV